MTSDQVALTRIVPASAGEGALAEGAIVVNSSDSPLSEASEQCDDLGMSYDGSFNLMHRTVQASASREPSRDPDRLRPHLLRSKTAHTSQVVPITRYTRIGTTWQEHDPRGASKVSGTSGKTRP